MSEPITWADIEPAHEVLAHALGGLDSILKRRGDLSERQAFRHGFVALNHGAEAALNHLTLVHNALLDAEETAPLARPARPLEAVLADIEAEGHEYTIDSNYGGGGKVRFTSKLPEPRWDNAGDWDEEKWARHRAWEQEVEAGDAWGPGSLAEVAEVRLAQIRALHAEKLERDGLAADVPDEVKRAAMERLAAEDRQREAGASEDDQG